MAVKIAKLFKDYNFQKLTQEARLLYIYLVSNPSLSTIGVFSPDIRVAALEAGLNKESFRGATQELTMKGFIHVKKYEDLIYFIIPRHFDTIPNSDATARKVVKLLAKLPDEFVTFLDSLGIKAGAKVVTFTKPSAEEVTQYAMSIGYMINGQEFVDYYDEVSGSKAYWVDGRGKMIRDWKSKLKRVWCKDDRKMKAVKGAPKGYEFFHVIKDGKAIYPDSWKDGKPWSKSISTNILLKREYEERKKDS